uniref:Putative secreted protein n=1 Tax=Anopheles darlingi TaxID=43151 RepID=A0A2M4DFA6_ANODA
MPRNATTMCLLLHPLVLPSSSTTTTSTTTTTTTTTSGSNKERVTGQQTGREDQAVGGGREVRNTISLATHTHTHIGYRLKAISSRLPQGWGLVSFSHRLHLTQNSLASWHGPSSDRGCCCCSGALLICSARCICLL